MIARRLTLTTLVLLCAMVGGLLLASAPAFAGDLQHAFSSSFGGAASTVTNPEPLLGPAGVAVEESTGNVYVVDRGNNRVEYFNSAGSFIGQFNGSAAPTGVFSSPEAIAVDNSGNPLDPSAGDVYVTDTGHQVIDKFTAMGTYLGQLKQYRANNIPHIFGELDGVAVDASGLVWVYLAIGELISFSDALSNESLAVRISPFGTHPGFAVDSSDDLYVNRGSEVIAKLNSKAETLVEEVDSEQTTAAAVELSSDAVYLDNVSTVAHFSSTGTLAERFGAGHLTSGSGIGVNSASGTVYVADASANVVDVFTGSVIVPNVRTGHVSDAASVEGEATLNGTVNPSGEPVSSCEFEYGATTAYGQTAPCAQPLGEIGSGTAPVAVSARVSGLVPSSEYHFRLLAGNANGTVYGGDQTFIALARPQITEQSVSDVSATSAQFSAHVAAGGEDTTLTFEYGTSTAYGKSLPQPPTDIGGGTSGVPVSVQAQGLEPGTTYHMRTAATNALGTSYGPDQTFTTQPGAAAFVLPDQRAWEMVSPPVKYGADIEPPSGTGLVQAAEDGSALAYDANGPFSENPAGNPSPLIKTQVLSRRRSGGGWSTEDIVASGGTVHCNELCRQAEYLSFSSDLSRALLEPPYTTPLSPEVSSQTLYLRDTHAGSYVPLVTPADEPGGVTSIRPAGLVGTPDLSHVLLYSPEALTPNATRKEPQFGSLENLYEWGGGQLKLINVLPTGATTSAAAGPQVGSYDETLRHAISADGSRVFWGNSNELGSNDRALYIRDTVSEQTVAVDAPAPGVPRPERPESLFQTASATGSKVFFLSTERLTAESNLPQNGPVAPGEFSGVAEQSGMDLYVYDVEAHTLTDLSADHNGSEKANVQRLVLGAGEDGSVVYFVATGALAPGAQSGKVNLYVASETGSNWSAPRLVAVLSEEDSATWNVGGSLANYLQSPGGLASRLSPNGRFLAFMSDRSLTGYDNRDARSGRPDEEVFLYDEATGHLACVSCNPSGARPTGLVEAEEEGVGPATEAARNSWPLFDKLGIWQGHALAADIPAWDLVSLNSTSNLSDYGSRLLSDEGRLFFNSVDSLAPQDGNGTGDVYEFEPVGLGSCTAASAAFSERSGGCVSLISSGTGEESVVLDASGKGPGGAAGEDVFFMTASRLSSQDFDSSYDVYDAHSCSQVSPCASVPVAPPECSSGDSCKAAPSPQPAIFGAPPSATFSGAGNVTGVPAVRPKALTGSQRLARALAACRKNKDTRARRVACERQAKRRYRVAKRPKQTTRKGNR
jgi:hypothetical protein